MSVFVLDEGCTSLAEFASRVYAILGIAVISQRESSNYPEGHYYIGVSMGLSVEISRSDESGLLQRSYRVAVEVHFESPWIDDESWLAGLVELVGRILAMHGFSVFSETGAGHSRFKVVDRNAPLLEGAITIEPVIDV